MPRIHSHYSSTQLVLVRRVLVTDDELSLDEKGLLLCLLACNGPTELEDVYGLSFDNPKFQKMTLEELVERGYVRKSEDTDGAVCYHVYDRPIADKVEHYQGHAPRAITDDQDSGTE